MWSTWIVPLIHGSCLFLPTALGCLCLPLRDLSLHCPQDDSTGEILFDEVFHALSRCLSGLLRPFRVPGSCIDFQPEIYVTIQAYSSIIGLQSHQVLLYPFSKFVPSGLISDSPLTNSLSYPTASVQSPQLCWLLKGDCFLVISELLSYWKESILVVLKGLSISFGSVGIDWKNTSVTFPVSLWFWPWMCFMFPLSSFSSIRRFTGVLTTGITPRGGL